MSTKKIPGLYKRGDVWHMDKKILGQRICESTHAHTLFEAEQYVAHRIDEIRQARIYGVRVHRTFKEAAKKYLKENQHKRRIRDDVLQVKHLEPFIGDLPLQSIHMGTLSVFMEARRSQGVKNRTINYALQVARRILNLAAGEWMDEHGLTWLAHAPKIKLLTQNDARSPYPLNWEEQERLFDYLPTHLKQMALFAVNTGCREQEICSLQWQWEHHLNELNTSVFIVPGEFVKNGEDRLIVLNQVAQTAIESARGKHPTYVFTYRGRPTKSINNTAWKRARKLAGLDVRVHDLKHTFGRRLRAAGVSFEDRQDLLGHKSGRITTHYSAAEITGLIEAANRVCELRRSAPILRVVRGGQFPSRKCPAVAFEGSDENSLSN